MWRRRTREIKIRGGGSEWRDGKGIREGPGHVQGGTKCQGNVFIRRELGGYAKNIYKGRKRLACLLCHAVC